MEFVEEPLINELEMVGMIGESTENSTVWALLVMNLEIQPLIFLVNDEIVEPIEDETTLLTGFVSATSRLSWLATV